MKSFEKIMVYILIVLALLLFLLFFDIHNIPSKFGISISFWQDFLINFLAIAFTIYGTLAIVKLQINVEKKNSDKNDMLSKLLDCRLFSSLYMGVNSDGNGTNITEIGDNLTIFSYGINRIDLNIDQSLFKIFYETYKKEIPRKLMNELQLLLNDYTCYYKFFELDFYRVRYEYEFISINDLNSKNYILLDKSYAHLDGVLVMKSSEKLNFYEFKIENLRSSVEINVMIFFEKYDQYVKEKKQLDIIFCNFGDAGDFNEVIVSTLIFDNRVKKICEDMVLFLSNN